MYTSAFDSSERLDRAGQFAFQSALIIDLLGKLADADFLIFKQFKSNQAALGKSLSGKAKAGVVNDSLRHENRVAAFAESIGDVLLLQGGNNLAAIFFVLNRKQHGIRRFTSPEQSANQNRHKHGNEYDGNKFLTGVHTNERLQRYRERACGRCSFSHVFRLGPDFSEVFGSIHPRAKYELLKCTWFPKEAVIYAGISDARSMSIVLFAGCDSAIIKPMPSSPVTASPLDPASSAQVEPKEALRLAEAFQIFSQASEELAGAYSGLQAQVARLTEELAAANGALRQQYQEKAALTERLSLLLDALPAGVVVLDDAGGVVQINPAASRFLGGVKVGAGWTAIEAAALEPGDTPGEFLAGDRRLAIAVTPLDSAGGRIVLLNDITEAQLLKTRVERNQRLAAMGEMAAQLAHQLRTPLAAALLYAGNLENPDLSAASSLAIAQKTVARLKHIEQLIQNMLLFTRGEALGNERFSVEELMEELAQNFEPLAHSRGVHFAVTDTSDGALLTGKRESIVGALTSMLENALQALEGCESGNIVLSAKREGNMLAFSVRDNGRGMDKLTASRLFEPFYTTRSDGTGLGLAIARGVARVHGGGIDVVSSLGAGAEFTLSLPCPES